MTEIRVNRYDNIDDVLRRFRRLVGTSGIKKELRKRKAYRKPSIAKQIKHKMHLKKVKREENLYKD